jgi:hypothetical protein
MLVRPPEVGRGNVWERCAMNAHTTFASPHPGGRVCAVGLQNIVGRGGPIKRLDRALLRHPEVGRGPVVGYFA